VLVGLISIIFGQIQYIKRYEVEAV